MKIKQILTTAIIAALPMTAIAGNISGAMYIAPTTADTNHPAPTTNAAAPYGRVDIDTADQDHIASTAYVKGAYNSAIAAVNAVDDVLQNVSRFVNEEIESGINDKQDRLVNVDTEGYIINSVLGAEGFLEYVYDEGDGPSNPDIVLATAAAIRTGIKSQRAEVWTTWEDDSAKTEVAFVTTME